MSLLNNRSDLQTIVLFNQCLIFFNRENSCMSATDQARVLMMRHHHFVKNRQQSMLSRAGAEVGLPADAAAHHWNPVQGKPNASFRMSYDRSGVGLS